MNTNRIKSDGFSNPATQRYFVENWSDGRYCEESDERRCCGFCRHAHFVECEGYPWVISLNPDSAYYYAPRHRICGHCGWSWSVGKEGQILCLNPESPEIKLITPLAK